ncbi:MAG: PolC-type DNA polymerase III [bacterium]
MKTPFDNFEYCVFDLETTGMNPETGAEIIEVGAVKMNGEEITDEFQEFVKPEGTIPGKLRGTLKMRILIGMYWIGSSSLWGMLISWLIIFRSI